MMNTKLKTFLFLMLTLGTSLFAIYFAKLPPRNNEPEPISLSQQKRLTIDELTEENYVIHYVKKHRKLPEYYITKNEARNAGWIASKGNLCEVLPGKAIGGDRFSNREKKLPKGKQYYEADVNYHCGKRGADRIIFTKTGEVYLTKNHYKSFNKK